MKLEDIKLPKEDKGLEEFIIRKCAANTYFIYDKKGEAVCTRCGYRFTNKSLRHNRLAICPRCKSKGDAKSSGRGRKGLTDSFRVLSVKAHRGKIYARSYVINLVYEEADLPEVYGYIDEIFIIGDKKEKYRLYDHTREYRPYKNIALSHAPSTYGMINPLENVYIFSSLEKVFQKTKLKYVYDEKLIKSLDAFELIKFIHIAWDYQSVELLLKAGFERLVTDKVSGKPSGSVYWRGKELQSILRLNMAEIKKIREWDISAKLLKEFQKLSESERARVTLDELQQILSLPSYREEFKEVPKYKFIKYKNKHDIYNYDYADYLKAAKELGMNISDKRVMFPKNFQRAHDQALTMKSVTEDERKNEAIALKTFDFSVEKNNLIAFMARSQTELTRESASLKHCVRTYGDRVAKGTSLIFFIRKAESPDKSFYTLELGPDGEFRQCRGKSNCEMTNEVEKFKDYVQEEFIKALKERRKAA